MRVGAIRVASTARMTYSGAMRIYDTLESVPSWTHGGLTREIVARHAPKYPRAYLRMALERMIPKLDVLQVDVRVAEGHLHLDGDLETYEPHRLGLLIVTGDLVIRGGYFDTDHPPMMLLVLGSMTVDRMITSGWVDVLGDLTVSGPLIGDYNDCSARIGGDVRCALFHPENHHFEVGGRLVTPVAIGSKWRLEAAEPVDFVGEHDAALLEVLDRDLVRVEEHRWTDDDGVEQVELEIDGIDSGAFLDRIRRSLPVERRRPSKPQKDDPM